MKYILALLILTTTAFANAPDLSYVNIVVDKSLKDKFITLETTDGDLIKWPKQVIPQIRIFSVSTKHERHAIYRLIVRDKTKRYEIPITEESYLKYKREMGIK